MLVVLSVSGPAYGIEVVDQKQEAVGASISIKNNPLVGQEFVPTLWNLVAVEVHVAVNVQNVPTSQLTLSIRKGTINGPLIPGSTQSKDVSGNAGDKFWVRFDFPVPLTVTPGNTYVIRLEANDPSGFLSWSDVHTNAYPSGRGIRVSVPSDTIDFAFRTYADPSLPAPSEPPSNPTGHVGGSLFTANKAVILAPYLMALFSVIAVAAVLVKKKFT